MARSDDPRTTIRWDPDVHAWLVRMVGRSGAAGLGTVVQAIVRAEMVRSERAEVEAAIAAAAGSGTSPLVKGGEVAVERASSQPDLMAALEESLTEVSVAGRSAGAAGTVPRGAAPVPRPGAAPAARSGGVRLDVAVARALTPGAGPIPPIAVATARRMIKAGEVAVSGRGSEELEPDMLVGPGEVVLL